MASLTVTKNGTLNPAAGVVSYDDSTTLAYAAGDDLTLAAGVTLRINSSTTSRPHGTITGSLGSMLQVSNASTTTPIVVQQFDNTKKYSFSDLCTFQIRGQWMDIATGTGAASQTLNFTTLMGGVVDRPPVVLVETGNGTGVFVPFFNIGLSTDANAMALSQFAGDINHGCVFSYDPSTKIATFGNGTNGAVIPSGARVRYPNIHFTTGTIAVAATNRSEMAVRNGAVLDAQNCAFSLGYTFNGSTGSFAPSSVSLVGFAFGGKIILDTVSRSIYCNGVYAAPELLFQANVYAISMGGAALTDVSNLYGMCAANAGINGAIYFSSLRNLRSVSNINGWSKVTGSAIRPGVNFSQCASYQSALPVVVQGVQTIGGNLGMSNCKLVNVKGLNHSDQVGGFAAKTSTSPTYILQMTGSTNCVVSTIRMVAGGAAPASHPVSIDIASYNCVAYDIQYDGQSNLSSTGSIIGSGSFYTNVNITNAKNSIPNSASLPSVRYCNLTGTALNPSSVQGGQQEFVQALSGTSAFTSNNGLSDISPHNLWVTTGAATGTLGIGPYTPNNVLSLGTVVSGTQDTDFYISAAGINLPGIAQVIFTGRWRLRGITSFTGGAITQNGSNLSSVTIEFRLRRPNGAWSAWYDATVAANYQTCLNTLSGYTSNEGFEMQSRVTTSVASATTRQFQNIRVPVNTDSAFTAPEIGYVGITASNIVSGSTLALYDGTTLVNIQQVTSSSYAFEYPYNFDGNYKSYKLVVRKAGYGELVINDQVHQVGTTQPLAQTQYVAVDEAAAAALTGIAIDGPSKTITITESHQIGDVYNYTQWWSEQTANIAYPVPVTTTDGTNLTSTYTWVVNGVALTTSTGKTLTLPSTPLTLLNGATAAFLYTSSAGQSANLQLANVPAGATIYVADGAGDEVDTVVAFAGGTYSLYINPGASGTWTWKVAKYGYLAADGSFTPGDGGLISAIVVLGTDTGVSEASAATVAAYATLDTLDQRYDYSAYFETTAAGIVYPRIADKAGYVLDWGSKNIVNDPLAASVFAWNNGTNTLTMKPAGAVSPGATFTESKTTGTVTFLDGSWMNVIYTDASGRRVFAKAPNLVSGTRVQLFNVTDDVEIDNSLVGAGGYSIQLIYNADKDFRLRATYQNGLTAMLPLEVIGTFTSNGFSVASAQESDAVYVSNAIDGSGVTEFTPDFPHVQVDVSGGTSTSPQRLYAWLAYEQTQASGIQNFFNAITAGDTANYKVNASIVNLQLNNVTASPVTIAGGYLSRSDGQTVIAPTSGSIQMDPGKAYVATNIANDVTQVRNVVEADEVYVQATGLLHTYQRGTTTDLIPPKHVSGTSQSQNSSLAQ